ncbi:hypothetical protein N1030_00965 [Desulfovibrio mangrovi]|uniref:N-acyl amino acid synthase FeeM domain-containing protein n=1 Tax=Desulfovibrio mangrovi TaxID=2976983 RepID=UPI00224647E8|nr:hypothetical protein [Desulfovibrio mangrovi]UZP67567.1 hypothetical protein N1030_00965 [Desulfovibrio mangrovi]
MQTGQDRRRTIRIRRSSLLQCKLGNIDRPAIKIAEEADEYKQAFRIIYDEYLKETYAKPHASKMLYSAYSMLPKSVTFIFKSYLEVLSTVTLVQDTKLFGLPMDSLYKDEIQALRDSGRKVAEIANLATRRVHRWSNLMIYLARALYRYALFCKVDDVVIMVNPKHVRFYKDILLFEDFGEEKHYEAVGAPAVALRANMDSFSKSLAGAYAEADFETDLYSFFVKINHAENEPEVEYSAEKNRLMDMQLASELFDARPDLLRSLNPKQREYLEVVYHQALFCGGLFGEGEIIGHA